MSTAVLPIEMSLEEFLARPEREDGQREELIEGELLVSPSPKFQHFYIVEKLREALRPLLAQGFFITNEFSCILGKKSMPEPDLLVVREDRTRKLLQEDGWLTDSPELVIEVNSRSNRQPHQKAALYLRHGAEQVWTVYPKKRTVLVATQEGSSEARMGESVEFHGVTVNVDEIFPK